MVFGEGGGGDVEEIPQGLKRLRKKGGSEVEIEIECSRG
jgi:hypothetical protein